MKPSVLNGDISDNGRLVTFGENNSLWVRNIATGTTTRFWHEPDAPPCQPFPEGSAGRPVISGNGRYVAFSTCATKIPGADGQHGQVYRMKLSDRSITLVSKTGHGSADADSYLPSLSRNGRYVGFGSDATDLAPDTGTDPDAFVADLRTGVITRASQASDGTESNNWSASTAAVHQRRRPHAGLRVVRDQPGRRRRLRLGRGLRLARLSLPTPRLGLLTSLEDVDGGDLVGEEHRHAALFAGGVGHV